MKVELTFEYDGVNYSTLEVAEAAAVRDRVSEMIEGSVCKRHGQGVNDFKVIAVDPEVLFELDSCCSEFNAEIYASLSAALDAEAEHEEPS